MSSLKTYLLLGLLGIFFVLLGEQIGGRDGMTIALIFSFIMSFGSYWFSDKIVLSMYHARELSETDAPELHRIVAELAQNAGIPKPRIYIVDTPTPNAFATGRDPQHAAVVVTSGILHLLNTRELRGVLSHELSHIKHRDTLIMAVAATIASAITYLSRLALWFGGLGGRRRRGGTAIDGIVYLLAVILAPIAAMLIQLAISRNREYMADETGARISGDPLALANALQKLAYGVAAYPMRDANPATAHLFIVNPLNGGGLASLFSTHPPIEKRIERLKKLAYEMGMVS